MTLEEAVQWCIDHEADLSFSKTNGEVYIYVYVDSYSGDDIEPICESSTLVGAVEQAAKVLENQ